MDLVQTYTRRWPAQENSIRDWLMPLGIDVNHGYAKTAAANSEVAKKREALQKRLEHVQWWAVGVRRRMHNASLLHRKRCQRRKHTRMPSIALSMRINGCWSGKASEDWLLRKTIKEEQAVADADIEAYRQRQWNAYETSSREFAKCQKYCREQRELLRALENLAHQEREMYALDNHKDQVMTVCKVALANLVMWTRDRYFPASYAQATWHRLAPFFHLPGRVVWGTDQVIVELRPFNDRRLTRDLVELCQQVEAAPPQLPDRRRFVLCVASARPFPGAAPAMC